MSNGRRSVPSLPVPILRDAVARETVRASLRRAAREIGTSPNGLRNFLNGASPRLSTRAKLERWLAANTRPSRPPGVGQLLRLIEELTADLSPQLVTKLTREIAALIEEGYTEYRLSPPRWVRDLARRAARSTRRDSESVA